LKVDKWTIVNILIINGKDEWGNRHPFILKSDMKTAPKFT